MGWTVVCVTYARINLTFLSCPFLVVHPYCYRVGNLVLFSDELIAFLQTRGSLCKRVRTPTHDFIELTVKVKKCDEFFWFLFTLIIQLRDRILVKFVHHKYVHRST